MIDGEKILKKKHEIEIQGYKSKISALEKEKLEAQEVNQIATREIRDNLFHSY